MKKALHMLPAHEVPNPSGSSVNKDAVFAAFLQTLKGKRVQIVAYEGLLAAVQGRKVVVLGGYSALGYRDLPSLRVLIRNLMKSRGDGVLYVIGATGDGIGAAYRWIPELSAGLGLRDIRTAGIVSSNACFTGIEDQDFILFVDTPPGEWSVVVDGKSMMVDIAADTDGEMVYFRGGAVAKAEIEEALVRKVRVSIVDGYGTEPDPAKVEAKRSVDAEYVVDGTSALVEVCSRQSGGMDLRWMVG